MTLSRGGVPRRSPVIALVAPADMSQPFEVVLVQPSSVAFSDVIGGGLLDEALVGVCEGGRFEVYLDRDRRTKDLAVNDRAAALLARLGYAEQNLLGGLRGDTLVGVDTRGGDCDVPSGVLVAACQSRQRVTVHVDTVEPTP